MMIIENAYNIGDLVYLITDKDQNPGLITSIRVYKNGEYLYNVVRGTIESNHYDFELSYEKNTLITVE